jgi:hypothetical protein
VQSTYTFSCVKSLLSIPILIERLKVWDKEWSERDISAFAYGIRSLEGIDTNDAELIKLGAIKINESSAILSSRAIGNALYGLQDFTSDTGGISELCAKESNFWLTS